MPGLIGSITGWCNLKLTGPTEVTGMPGEEKELTFEVTSEVRVDVTTQVGTKREGEQQYQIAVDSLKVPAWGKVPVTLKFTVGDRPYTVRVKVNPNETILENDYSDNYVDVTVKPTAPAVPGNQGGEDQSSSGEGDISAELILYARSRGGQDIYGNYKPPEDRPVNTAKYADIVKAVLRPKPPTPLRGRLVSWEIVSATLTYPKRNPEFSFGHPTAEPVGTVTVAMVSNGHEATVEFEEDWSLAGAPIYDMLADKMAPPPTEYTITAEYTIRYTYEYEVTRSRTYTDENGETRTETWTESVRREATASGTASGKLLVNGTGINIL